MPMFALDLAEVLAWEVMSPDAASELLDGEDVVLIEHDSMAEVDVQELFISAVEELGSADESEEGEEGPGIGHEELIEKLRELKDGITWVRSL